MILIEKNQEILKKISINNVSNNFINFNVYNLYGVLYKVIMG